METAEGEEEEEVVRSPMLGLQAVARVPRLQLLLMTLQHLRKEAGTDRTNDPVFILSLNVGALISKKSARYTTMTRFFADSRFGTLTRPLIGRLRP